MIDSTGLRIHVGTARKPPKQRAWRKLHIAVDRKTGTIVASELTASRARDATRVPALLTQIQAPLAWVAADSAYDKETVYKAIEAHSPGRRTRVVIPPQRNATLSQNSNTAMQERDRHIRAIERHGRREWYKLSGCTKRSMVENAVYRYKVSIAGASDPPIAGLKRSTSSSRKPACLTSKSPTLCEAISFPGWSRLWRR